MVSLFLVCTTLSVFIFTCQSIKLVENAENSAQHRMMMYFLTLNRWSHSQSHQFFKISIENGIDAVRKYNKIKTWSTSINFLCNHPCQNRLSMEFYIDISYAYISAMAPNTQFNEIFKWNDAHFYLVYRPFSYFRTILRTQPASLRMHPPNLDLYLFSFIEFNTQVCHLDLSWRKFITIDRNRFNIALTIQYHSGVFKYMLCSLSHLNAMLYMTFICVELVEHAIKHLILAIFSRTTVDNLICIDNDKWIWIVRSNIALIALIIMKNFVFNCVRSQRRSKLIRIDDAVGTFHFLFKYIDVRTRKKISIIFYFNLTA